MIIDPVELERLSKAATQGVWRYRPDEHDDWGIVKSPVLSDGFACVLAQFRDPDALDSETLARHRETKTDPWEANARFVVALVNAYRTGQLVPAQPSGDVVEAVADAIERANCPGREGPFGGYDYGHNEDFYGKAPEGGRYVIRDFRNPASRDWGKWLHQTDDPNEHLAIFEKMTREHIATAAITTYEAVSGVAKMREALKKIATVDESGLAEYTPQAMVAQALAALGEKP